MHLARQLIHRKSSVQLHRVAHTRYTPRSLRLARENFALVLLRYRPVPVDDFLPESWVCDDSLQLFGFVLSNVVDRVDVLGQPGRVQPRVACRYSQRRMRMRSSFGFYTVPALRDIDSDSEDRLAPARAHTHTLGKLVKLFLLVVVMLVFN